MSSPAALRHREARIALTRPSATLSLWERVLLPSPKGRGDGGEGPERGVEFRQCLFDGRVHAGVDAVNLRVVGDGLGRPSRRAC